MTPDTISAICFLFFLFFAYLWICMWIFNRCAEIERQELLGENKMILEDTIVLGKDLKVGDCIRGESRCGIILRINGLVNFYGDKQHLEIFNINCPCEGPCSTPFKLDDKYTLINSRKEILRYYDLVELHLLRRAQQLVNNRNDLVDVKDEIIQRLNNKERY